MTNDLVALSYHESTPATWSHAEISSLRVTMHEGADPTGSLGSLYRAVFSYERAVWIEIVFLRWRFSESSQSPWLSPLN